MKAGNLCISDTLAPDNFTKFQYRKQFRKMMDVFATKKPLTILL
jgi:hypothetical protein